MSTAKAAGVLPLLSVSSGGSGGGGGRGKRRHYGSTVHRSGVRGWRGSYASGNGDDAEDDADVGDHNGAGAGGIAGGCSREALRLRAVAAGARELDVPELPRSRLATYARVARYLQPHRLAISAALLLTVASTASLLAVMRLFGLLSAAVGRGSVAHVLRYAGFCTALLTAKCAAQYGQDVLLAHTCIDVTTQLRRATVEHVLALGADERDGADSGELVYRATAEIDRVGGACVTMLRNMLPSLVQFVGVLCYMACVSPMLTVGVLATAPLMAGVYGALERRLETSVRDAQQHMSQLAAHCTEAFRHVRLVQAYLAQRFVMRSVDSVAERLRGARKRADALRALISPAVTLCYALTVLVLLALSAMSIARGRLTAAELVTFLTCVAFLIEPIQLLVSKFGELKEGELAAARMFALLARRPRIRDRAEHRVGPEAAAAAKTTGRSDGDGSCVGDGTAIIELRDVWYSYHASAGEAECALRGVSLRFNVGETVALVGGSGAGKSTLVALLSRLRDPTRGAVLFDGVDARDLPLRDVRRRVAVVPQDAPTLSGSVRDNIVFGAAADDDDDHNAAAGRVERASRAAHAHEFIARSLPAGYDTAVGEGGAALSGGQRQRIAIARAFYRDAPVLVLDEATSALDAESERMVQEALERVLRAEQRKTVIIIAHRLATLRHVDRVVVMERGVVVEQGTHDALMARSGGRYAALFRAQQFDGAEGRAGETRTG